MCISKRQYSIHSPDRNLKFAFLFFDVLRSYTNLHSRMSAFLKCQKKHGSAGTRNQEHLRLQVYSLFITINTFSVLLNVCYFLFLKDPVMQNNCLNNIFLFIDGTRICQTIYRSIHTVDHLGE